jgi:hypothetical protein
LPVCSIFEIVLQNLWKRYKKKEERGVVILKRVTSEIVRSSSAV